MYRNFTMEISRDGDTQILCINAHMIAWATPSQLYKASETELGFKSLPKSQITEWVMQMTDPKQ